MRIRLTLLAALAVLFAALPVMAQQFSSLEERMTVADFRAAGLNKLTPQELKFLNHWLRTHGLVQSKAATEHNQSQPVAPPSPPSPTQQPRAKFHAHLVGPFRGWSGHTVFRLNNGEVWKQAESGAYSCPSIDNPQVTIKPMILGSWLMYVQGCNQSVRVEQVK
jgi:hypothetical protein